METLSRLAEQFGRLEGVGRKSAYRMAFSLLNLSSDEVEEFTGAMKDAKEKIHACPICCNLTDRDICSVCADPARDRGVICVVSDVRTVMAMEKVREFNGTYHVLGGVISPMNGITPDQLSIAGLLQRIQTSKEPPVREVIVATNPTIEGEATAMYLANIIKPFGVKVSRLAYGMPVGADLEYADEDTLCRALEGRRDV